jgi:hypothetical protein
MTRTLTLSLLLLLVPALVPSPSRAQISEDFHGNWTLVQHRSTEIDLWRTISLEISSADDRLELIQHWGSPRRRFSDTLSLAIGTPNRIPVTDRNFPTNVFMGISNDVRGEREFMVSVEKEGARIRIVENVDIRSSQGAGSVTQTHTYALTDESDLITYTIRRPTRDIPVEYVLKREGSREAFVMDMTDDWTIEGDLPAQAFLISLQGLANEDAPKLYFRYGDEWDFRFTPAVFEFLRDERYWTFRELKSAEQALSQLKDAAAGYVVWDKEERTSLIVAYTVAGLERAVVVSEDLIPMVEEAGLEMIEDFRGRFTGRSDAEIYQWAYDRYWERCSKDYIVWLGGEHGRVMKPGVADFGMKKRVFFSDLSNHPKDTLEYALVQRLYSEMEPNSLVMGWHSYRKDKERDHVKLTSSYGHRIEGLHTLPNMSFMSQVPASPGFEFKNNHSVEPGEVIMPEEKVYIATIQTDGLGIGAWTRPGRGDIPYAWEVTMNWVWMAPAMMEFFYGQATPNDYFIGALSGPGYMYPKAIPADLRPPLIAEARRLMGLLDLRVFEIMDYSEGATVEGNTELTEEVVDDYYEGMPDAIGFVNGYAPAHTFTVKDGRALVSYDYYLSPSRPEDEAVADLNELAAINGERPYFLLMHVRQWSDITRVKAILDRLGPEFEHVPLDVFLTMAAQRPTFEERFLE